MTTQTLPGGTFTLAEDLTVHRVGYGAMQLAGPGVFGPPADRAAAVAVLREAVALGVNHIDTADFYGPYVTNEIIREALHPYAADLHVVTKVGAVRDAEGHWVLDREPVQAEVLQVLLHLAPEPGSLAPQFTALAEMRDEGLIRHLGVSTVTAEQVAEAQSIASVVCVQNSYNIANRGDDALIDSLAAQGIAYVPYFPLGGFSPLQSAELDAVAARLGSTPAAVAQAWLLRRSPNILLIPGTSSVAHLRENVAVADLVLPDDEVAVLDAIGG